MLFVYNWEREVSIIGVAQYPLFRGFECIEVNEKMVRTFRVVCYNVDVHC